MIDREQAKRAAQEVFDNAQIRAHIPERIVDAILALPDREVESQAVYFRAQIRERDAELARLRDENERLVETIESHAAQCDAGEAELAKARPVVEAAKMAKRLTLEGIVTQGVERTMAAFKQADDVLGSALAAYDEGKLELDEGCARRGGVCDCGERPCALDKGPVKSVVTDEAALERPEYDPLDTEGNLENNPHWPYG